MAEKAFTLSNGEIHESVDSIRLVISDGNDSSWVRLSDVWNFFPHKNNGDFFVTSSSMQREMKGSIHRSQAHFGFNKPFREVLPKNWVGPLPNSRLFHVLKIRDLEEGECQPIFSVSFPGFAHMQCPVPLQPRKHYIRVPSVPPIFEIAFRLTLIQGEWGRFIQETPNHRYVGLLKGENGRDALISVAINPYTDPKEEFDNLNRNLALVPTGEKEFKEDLSAHLWMQRNDGEPTPLIGKIAQPCAQLRLRRTA